MLGPSGSWTGGGCAPPRAERALASGTTAVLACNDLVALGLIEGLYAPKLTTTAMPTAACRGGRVTSRRSYSATRMYSGRWSDSRATSGTWQARMRPRAANR